MISYQNPPDSYLFSAFFYLVSFLHIKHTHVHSSIKDTGQCVDPALYGLQHAPLGGHVLLGRHGNTEETERQRDK